MELPLFILSISTKKNCSTKGKSTVLQKAKEPFYKRKKSRSTKGKRFVLLLKKKLLKRSRYTEINCRNMKENIK